MAATDHNQDSSGLALLLAVPEDRLRIHMQTFPFLNAPDENLNRECLRVLRENIRLRSGGSREAQPLGADSLLPSGPVLARLDNLFRQTELTKEECSYLVTDFAWKIQFVPETARTILAVGHHTGYELLFLRAAAPNAEIFAIDWVENSDKKITSLVGAKLVTGDFLTELKKFKGQFDVVFSNHVLEHMYDPDHAVRVMFELLADGGLILCGMPLDGNSGDAYQAFWAGHFLKGKQLRRVDMGHIDVGHPWKTSVFDLAATIEGAGFTNVEIYCRPNHLTRGRPTFASAELARYRQRGLGLNRLFFGPLRELIHLLFGDSCPPGVLKALFALERRVWFGSNRFKNAQSLEVVAMAVKPGRTLS